MALQYDPPLTAFTSSSLAGLNLTSPPLGVLRYTSLEFATPGLQQLALSTLASGRNYSIALVAVDRSSNMQPQPQVLLASAVDVTPPVFVTHSAFALADTAIGVNASLNEASRVFWVLLRTNATVPTAEQVRGCRLLVYCMGGRSCTLVLLMGCESFSALPLTSGLPDAPA